MTTFGVWCRRPSFDDITLAAGMGFTRLDVMVQDMAKQRTPTSFRMDWDAQDYRNVVGKATMAGIEEVHFTAWAMPHVTYMSYAGDCLQNLCMETGAHGIVLDAEEPWTLASKPDYRKAAEAFYTQAKGCRTGITGIGYANADKLGPLLDGADYGIPQCYSTNTSKVLPQNVGRLAKHWEKFGKPLVPGLAAYRQSGIAGHTSSSALRTARDTLAGFDTVIYWSLRQIKGSTLVRNTLRAMMEEDRKRQEGAA